MGAVGVLKRARLAKMPARGFCPEMPNSEGGVLSVPKRVRSRRGVLKVLPPLHGFGLFSISSITD